MNRKDIALTVTGVAAAMALTYLLYRQQQKSAQAQAQAAPAQDVTSPNYYTTEGDIYGSSAQYQYDQLASLSTPTVSSTSSTSALAPSVDTSASTAATGNPPESEANHLLAQIISGYYAAQGAPSATADFSSLQIPIMDAPPSVDLTGIPTTAQQAQEQIMQQTTAPAPISWPTGPGEQVCAGGSGGGGTCGTIPVVTINGFLDQSINPAVPAPSTQAPAVSSGGGAPTTNYNHISAMQQMVA